MISIILIHPSIKKHRKNYKNFINIITNFGGATRKQWNDLKKLILLSISFPVTLVTAGTIAGAVTLNPIILGTITGAGLLLKTTSEIKQYSNKIAMLKIGLSTYEKTLVDLRSFLRGKEYSREDFIFKMNLVDGDIADLYSIPEKILKKYKKNFE